MREILFRGQSIDRRKWYEGDLYQTRLKSVFYINYYTEHGDRMAVEVDPETVGQYTGMTDKNGKKIFEGDICRFRECSKGDMCWIGKVHYKYQQFLISGGKNKECDCPFIIPMSRLSSERIEVIGNIHDNPELLEGGEG